MDNDEMIGEQGESLTLKVMGCLYRKKLKLGNIIRTEREQKGSNNKEKIARRFENGGKANVEMNGILVLERENKWTVRCAEDTPEGRGNWRRESIIKTGKWTKMR